MPKRTAAVFTIIDSQWCPRGGCQRDDDGPTSPHVHLESWANPDQLCELPDTELGEQFWKVIRDSVIGGAYGDATCDSAGTIRGRIDLVRKLFGDAEAVSETQPLPLDVRNQARDLVELRSTIETLLKAFAPKSSKAQLRALANLSGQKKKQEGSESTDVVALPDAEAEVLLDAAKDRIRTLRNAQQELLVKWGLCSEDTVHVEWTVPSAADIVAAAEEHGVNVLDLDNNPAFDLNRFDIGALFAVLSLAGDTGCNLSWAQSLRSDSGSTGMIESPKMRAGRILAVPTDSASLSSPGGVFNTMRALQRISCEVRRRNTDIAAERAELLFCRRLTKSTENPGDGWRLLDASDVVDAVGHGSRVLRETAVHRRARNGDLSGVLGQSFDTTMTYLAYGLDDETAHDLMTKGQDEIIDVAERVLHNLPLDDEPVADDHANLGPVTCGSNGNDPEDLNSLCNRGPLACFTCPSARLHPINLPALSALSEVAHQKDDNTDTTTQFGAVAAAADAALKKFANQPDPDEVAAAVPVAMVFLNELRARQ